MTTFKGFSKLPAPYNEPVYAYEPGSAARAALQQTLAELKAYEADLPMIIGGKEVRTQQRVAIHPPHELAHTLGYFYKGDATHVQQAIDAALAAKEQWENLAWEHRAAIFLKAAELISGKYRYRINAATMLGQSKNAYQAEIDAVCELADFLRFNVQYMSEIYGGQPDSAKGIWNRLEYRPLEGFVLAITPFNFTAIAGNLPSAPAMMGNVVVWKPAETQIYSAHVIMDIFREAGLPDGVINLIHCDGPTTGNVVFAHPDFAGIHFTGSTGTFNFMWKTIGANIANYRSYPRIVGETGGNDFVLAHPSADPTVVAVGLARGAFEYQGQKCSAASRAYIPQSLWAAVKEQLCADLASFNMGITDDFGNFINAVIDEKSFDSITRYIAAAHNDPQVRIIAGGTYDKSKGYFIAPTVIETSNPRYVTMCDELFGPVLTIYVYPDEQFDETVELVNTTSPYALTGALFARDRYVIDRVAYALRHAAGNFYINDKPTGAVVNQQPFGGGRASGTNDKAGSYLNLVRWVSARSVKETFVPPTDYRYPFLAK